MVSGPAVPYTAKVPAPSKSYNAASAAVMWRVAPEAISISCAPVWVMVREFRLYQFVSSETSIAAFAPRSIVRSPAQKVVLTRNIQLFAPALLRSKDHTPPAANSAASQVSANGACPKSRKVCPVPEIKLKSSLLIFTNAPRSRVPRVAEASMSVKSCP